MLIWFLEWRAERTWTLEIFNRYYIYMFTVTRARIYFYMNDTNLTERVYNYFIGNWTLYLLTSV